MNKSDKNSQKEVLQNYLHQKSVANISKPFDEYVGIGDFKTGFVDSLFDAFPDIEIQP